MIAISAFRRYTTDKNKIMNDVLSRRNFLVSASAVTAASMFSLEVLAQEPIIDIHQHTHYAGRTDEALIAHQKTMGISKTVLLPAGSQLGLEADIFGNDSALALVKKYPKQYYFFANELPDIAETKQVIEKYLKLGAIGIGEQKYFVDSDSRSIELLAEIAREFRVPVLLHFQHGKYNMNFARFHKILAKFPTVNFIGHAQTFWNNIDSQIRSIGFISKTQSYCRRNYGSVVIRLREYVRRYVRWIRIECDDA